MVEDQDIDDHASGMYAKAIGSLMYAAIGTWPDIAFTVHTLARFTWAPQTKTLDCCEMCILLLKMNT